MSTSHRLARSMAVAIPAILLVATAAFAHSSNFSAAPAGTWTDQPDITNIGVVGDHEDVWQDADDQVGANDDGAAEAADQTAVDEPNGAETHVQHAKPDKAPKADAGAAADDDATEVENDQGENDDNDDQGDTENHDVSQDGADDGGDSGDSGDGGGGD